MRLKKLEELFESSLLHELFNIRVIKDYADKSFSAVRVKQNDFRVRSFELWDAQALGEYFCRIYHGKLPEPIKVELDSNKSKVRSGKNYSDFQGCEQKIFNFFYSIFSSDRAKEIAQEMKVYTRNSAYEGLVLPDVDVSETDVLGTGFTWKEIIAIYEDDSEENELKKVLSKPGIYLQRSIDGSARYVGSAYGGGGILERWLAHLAFNGNAKHLNLYVLENGYSSLVFTVLEFFDSSDEEEKKSYLLKQECRWKQTLGTRNSGPYDGLRLNKN